MKLFSQTQLLNRFNELRQYKRFILNDLFCEVFKTQEFDEVSDKDMLIGYLAMRLALAEKRIERLEEYIHV